jgi:hypothetical protein
VVYNKGPLTMTLVTVMAGMSLPSGASAHPSAWRESVPVMSSHMGLQSGFRGVLLYGKNGRNADRS